MHAPFRIRLGLTCGLGFGLGSALTAQSLTFAEGNPGAIDVLTIPEANPTAPATVVLSQVEWLPIEMTCRTQAVEFDATRTRRTVRDGIERLDLPGGGRLFHYRRANGSRYGFLHVAADGTATPVLDLPALGANLDSPFWDRIAVAADGRHAVVPLVAGGARVVKLDGSRFASTGRADAQLIPANYELVPTAIAVGPTHLFAQTEADEVLRCRLDGTAPPVDVTPPAVANGIFKPEFAIAGDGLRVVFLYGPRQQQRLYLLDTVAGPVQLPPPAAKYEEPNYLPEGAGEPAMLLNGDGSRLFYIDADVRDELHLLDTSGVLPDLQITENAIFQPYIGAHILPKFAANDLVVAIGDPGAMDWFRVGLAANGGTVVNLTGTGSVAQPFPSGQLAPLEAAESAGLLYVSEQTTQGQVLRRLDPLTGSTAVVLADLAGPAQIGSTFTAPADVVVTGAGGDTLIRAGALQPFAVTPPGILLTPPAQGPLLAATWVHLPIGWGIVAYYLPDGTILSGSIEFGVRQVAMTGAGGVLIRGQDLRYFAPGVTAVTLRNGAPGQVLLSGALTGN